MTTFYICRHGQTDNNKNRRLSGWIDTPLTDEGVRNSDSAASKLGGIQFTRVVSSDLGRAFITAYLLLKRLDLSLEIERSRELREVNYGDLNNMTISAFPKLTALENADYVHTNGESLIQMQHRVLTKIQALSMDNPDITILLVGHDGTINAINASFSGQSIGLVDANKRNSHDFVAKFEYDDGKIISFEEILSF